MTVTDLQPTEELEVPIKPFPGNSLLASARRLTAKSLKKAGGTGKTEAWQEDAWDMYDLVGEQRFLANTLANRLGQARFYVGRLPKNTTEDIEVISEGPAYEAFQSLHGSGEHFKQMIIRLGLNLFLPGDGWLLGVPKDLKDGSPKKQPAAAARNAITPFGAQPDQKDPIGDIDIDSLHWAMYSITELKTDKDGEITVKQDDEATKKYNADDVVLIRVWRPHPRRAWQADSPTRSSLPVLRELVGLTMKISANIDSRLAGSGILLVPASADAALRATMGAASQQTDNSPFADALMEAMITPISDRSNASSVVPLMPVVPDDSIEKFKWMENPNTKQDPEDRQNRNETIRRLALGEDCPPELLLGVAGMNHWGAWLVREDVVTTHLEPPLALMCDAITTQFLRPVLEEAGQEDFEDYVVWYDVDHMIQRPNRSQDAVQAKTLGIISDASTRDALGFDENDAPKADPTDPAIQLVLDMVRQAPSLAQQPGLSLLAQQVRAMLAGKVITPGDGQVAGDQPEEAPADTAEEPVEGGMPATQDAPAEEPAP